MSQIMTTWLDSYSSFNTSNVNLNSTAMHLIYDLLNKILDPCEMFGDSLLTKYAHVGVESIISGVNIVYDS